MKTSEIIRRAQTHLWDGLSPINPYSGFERETFSYSCDALRKGLMADSADEFSYNSALFCHIQQTLLELGLPRLSFGCFGDSALGAYPFTPEVQAWRFMWLEFVATVLEDEGD